MTDGTYPNLENRNLQMLNRLEMKEPCKKLIEIIEVCDTIKPLMKVGGLAL